MPQNLVIYIYESSISYLNRETSILYEQHIDQLQRIFQGQPKFYTYYGKHTRVFSKTAKSVIRPQRD